MRQLLWIGAAVAAANAGCDSATRCEGASCGAGGGTTTAGTTTGSTTTGGTGGEGGSPAKVWTVPACTAVKGDVPVTFSSDEGATLAPIEAELGGVLYLHGLVALDIPNVLLAHYDAGLFRSDDAGCTWSLIAPTRSPLSRLTSAQGGRAYGWEDNGTRLYRYDAAGLRNLPVNDAYTLGLGADPDNGLHVRIVDGLGGVRDSADAGESYDKIGSPIYADPGYVYRAAFDPADLDHLLVGSMVDGIHVSFDGGTTWQLATGLGSPNANAFSVVVSPADGNVVWVEGITLGPDERHVFRSEDGGLTFVPVLDEAPPVTLTNGVPMMAHPTDPNVLYFEFGTYFADYGTDLYRYDHASGQVTLTHNGYNDMDVFIASPADPSLLYLGITSSVIAN